MLVTAVPHFLAEKSYALNTRLLRNCLCFVQAPSLSSCLPNGFLYTELLIGVYVLQTQFKVNFEFS